MAESFNWGFLVKIAVSFTSPLGTSAESVSHPPPPSTLHVFTHFFFSDREKMDDAAKIAVVETAQLATI